MNNRSILRLGDIIAFAVLTLIGFATHGETALSFIPRMTITFLPLLLGWFLLAPWLGLFDEQVIANPKNLWRIVLAMIFIAPLAATLRGAWLGDSVIPLFALILGGSSALGIMVWRWVYIFIARPAAK